MSTSRTGKNKTATSKNSMELNHPHLTTKTNHTHRHFFFLLRVTLWGVFFPPTSQNNTIHIFVRLRSNQGRQRRLGIECKHVDSGCRIPVARQANTITRYIKKNTWLRQQKPPVCIWPCRMTEVETKREVMGRRTKEAKHGGKRAWQVQRGGKQEDNWKEWVVTASKIHQFFVYTKKINSKSALSFWKTL